MQNRKLHYSLANISDAAAQLWSIGKDYAVWVVEGEMGAGKTTLIAALCKHLVVIDKVSSPTYSIINEYQFKDENDCVKTIFHSDWYRLKDTNDAREAGVEDILYKANTYAFVEWASRAAELLHRPFLLVKIVVANEEERTLTISVAAQYS